MRKLIAFPICTALLAMATPAYSAGIPVIDAANLAKMAEEMVTIQQQLDQMTEAYSKQLEQLDQATQQTGAITGTRNMGTLLNGAEEEQMRYYVPDNMNDLMDIGNKDVASSSGAVQESFASLQDKYQPLSPEDFGENGALLPGNAAYLQHSNTDHAAMAASQAAYNNTANRMKGYEALLKELDNTKDIKASIDLLARISVENGIIMNEMMRLQAVQMQLTATSDNQALTEHRALYNANKPLPAHQ